MARRGWMTLCWTAAIYVAVVLQTGLGEGSQGVVVPIFTAAVAAWAVTALSPSSGVLWAALAGLACDAAGHDRLGLHVATYAVLSACASQLPSARIRRGWSSAVIAFAIAGGDQFASGVLGMVLGSDHRGVLQIGLTAMGTGSTTGGVVLAIVTIFWIIRRVISANDSLRPLQLANRWTMLTE
jgi:rod shape-determining protein MreD